MVIKCLAAAADAIYRRRRELPRLATVGSTLIDSGLSSVRAVLLSKCSYRSAMAAAVPSRDGVGYEGGGGKCQQSEAVSAHR